MQSFDGFASVKEAEQFAVQISNSRGFDGERKKCVILSSFLYPGKFMVKVEDRFMSHCEFERLLDASC